MRAAIQGSETAEKHVMYIYDALMAKSSASQLYVLAVGNGGRCAVNLIRSRGS